MSPYGRDLRLTRLALLGAAMFAWSGCADLPAIMATDGTTDSTSTTAADSTGPSGVDTVDTGSSEAGVDTTTETGPLSCGNEMVDAGEDCDGSDLAGADCASQGFLRGRLACGTDCTYDTADCDSPICGDDVAAGTEACDGSDLAGADCESQGFASGRLGCLADCSDFDTSDCSEYDGDCCSPSPSPGCQDPQCSAAVCAINPFCCDIAWDTTCVDAALGEVACQGVGGSCPPLGDCCVASAIPGCDDPECTDAVCDLRAECCTEQWNGSCAGAAADLAACQGVGSCPVSMCGDGFADATEACDAADLAGQTCVTQGFEGGMLGCMGDCSAFDTSECSDFSGACCGAHVSPGCADAECTAAVCAVNSFCCNGFWDNGCVDTATVEPACFGTAGCPDSVCGDDVAQVGEVCDSSDLEGEDCVTQGFDGGQLGCLDDCSAFDTSTCGDFSGNCCEAHGNPGCGDPECTAAVCATMPSCCTNSWSDACQTLATTTTACEGTVGCPAPTCGNGVIQDLEQCEQGDLGGQTCATLGMGFDGGVLQCNMDCTLNSSSCAPFEGDCCVSDGTPGCANPACTAAVCDVIPSCCDVAWDAACAAEAMNQPFVCHGLPSCPMSLCGNGQAQGVELCDGADLNGETCATQGFGGGTLGCLPLCVGFVTSGCHTGDCCISHGGPGCGDFACESAICAIDPSCCDEWDNACAVLATNEPACEGDGTCPANECGNGIVQGGEACDGVEVGGMDCISLGFVGGALACLDDCSGVDTSVCWGGDCCMADDTPGCGDVACTNSVCSYDPYCCASTWDAICAGEAVVDANCHDEDDESSCPNPTCGDGFAEGSEICDGADSQGRSCISEGFGGGPPLTCQGNCAGFDTSACYEGDCCTAHGGPGCDDPECTEAICALGEAGAACCTNSWITACADAALVTPACQGVGGTCPL
jgi:hypothetical protein